MRLDQYAFARPPAPLVPDEDPGLTHEGIR